ncbi:MAG: (4Fe-4S)-binding protein [Actinomycetaceae bacterium]|nr:(4Fe-4S)-binding protein [Arcanobacterium sp.]MDD7504749.1 (4Fe-4S)-binding protein [Actinomycetaceae bacterium]MDY6143580.1 (4Fe-4S)-binding protein [Arcanobacterium sp.]
MAENVKDGAKEYLGEDLAVIWKAKLCQHSGICVRTLPQVYDLDKRPWISPLSASTDELISQIDRCPSGALTYRMLTDDEKAQRA